SVHRRRLPRREPGRWLAAARSRPPPDEVAHAVEIELRRGAIGSVEADDEAPVTHPVGERLEGHDTLAPQDIVDEIEDGQAVVARRGAGNLGHAGDPQKAGRRAHLRRLAAALLEDDGPCLHEAGGRLVAEVNDPRRPSAADDAVPVAEIAELVV